MINSWVLGSCQVRQGSSGSKLRPGGAPGDEGRRGENNGREPLPGVGGGLPGTSTGSGGLTCRHTRDFSRRNCSMRAPSITPLGLK